MKSIFFTAAAITVATSAVAQSSPPTQDIDLIGLITPVTLETGKYQLGLQINAFGGADSLARTGISVKYGLATNWELRLAGTFGAFDSTALPSGNSLGFGGSDGNLVLKYRLPGCIATTIETGIGYADTPAQQRKVAALLGASVGYSVLNGVRVYANPKLVELQDNALFAVSVGAVVDVASGVSLCGVWTPLFDGTNAVSEIDGTGSRQQLYAFGIRFDKWVKGVSVDLGFTNMIGQTYGFSLTPSLGNSAGGYVSLNYQF